jgi:hypothetical protein
MDSFLGKEWKLKPLLVCVVLLFIFLLLGCTGSDTFVIQNTKLNKLFDGNVGGDSGLVPFLNEDGNLLEVQTGFDFNVDTNTLSTGCVGLGDGNVFCGSDDFGSGGDTSNLIPYTGATNDLELGNNNLFIGENTTIVDFSTGATFMNALTTTIMLSDPYKVVPDDIPVFDVDYTSPYYLIFTDGALSGQKFQIYKTIEQYGLIRYNALYLNGYSSGATSGDGFIITEKKENDFNIIGDICFEEGCINGYDLVDGAKVLIRMNNNSSTSSTFASSNVADLRSYGKIKRISIQKEVTGVAGTEQYLFLQMSADQVKQLRNKEIYFDMYAPNYGASNVGHGIVYFLIANDSGQSMAWLSASSSGSTTVNAGFVRVFDDMSYFTVQTSIGTYSEAFVLKNKGIASSLDFMVDSGASVGAIIPKGDYDYVIDFR